MVGGEHLFVFNEGSNDISVFSIEPLTGLLNLVSQVPLPTELPIGSQLSLAVTPDNRFLYAAAVSNNIPDVGNHVTGYGISATGALSFKFSLPVDGTLFGGIKVSPDAKFLAVGFDPSSVTPPLRPGVLMFGINSDGSLNPVQDPSQVRVSDNSSIRDVDIDCGNTHVYASGEAIGSNSSLYVFEIRPGGLLVQIPGSPFINSGFVDAPRVLLSPGDRVLVVNNLTVVNNRLGSTINTFRLDSNSAPSLVQGSPFSDPGLTGMATDQAGLFLFTTNLVNLPSLTLGVLSMAPSGFLKSVPGSPFPISAGAPGIPTSVAVFPPKSCSLGETAAARAKSLLALPYFEGAKGYDLSLSPTQYVSGDANFDPNPTIATKYTHCDGKAFCVGRSSRKDLLDKHSL